MQISYSQSHPRDTYTARRTDWCALQTQYPIRYFSSVVRKEIEYVDTVFRDMYNSSDLVVRGFGSAALTIHKENP